jgi:hypothetical protein
MPYLERITGPGCKTGGEGKSTSNEHEPSIEREAAGPGGGDREASWYRLQDAGSDSVHRWVVSTPHTRRICNYPEIIGVEFSRMMRQGITAAFRSAPFLPFLRSVSSSRLCTVNFLRGGLNFDLRGVLHDALGSNTHVTCFMSSQRFREHGQWRIREDMYRKIHVPDGAVLLVGDVVATGVTAENGLAVVERYLKEHDVPILGLIYVTLGCPMAERILDDCHQRFSSHFSDYVETHLVYLEGRFELVTNPSPVVIGIPGTDLIKREALVAPELAYSQYESLSPPLERCIIYDAGSRAFDAREYLDDVIEYWEQVRRLARRGFTLREALRERWPEKGWETLDGLVEQASQAWHGVPREEIEALWQSYRKRWSRKLEARAATREALEEVATSRLRALRSLIGETPQGGSS